MKIAKDLKSEKIKCNSVMEPKSIVMKKEEQKIA